MCVYAIWRLWISDGGKRQIGLLLYLASLFWVVLNKNAHVYIYIFKT